ncbi:MAG TPA: beta-ketoacyl synthase N-terminal-like domain-containing protein [Thermoanaerobaculia bacterium]|jgi:3-oxoacyl-(acyl-carrier-protein) synthase
MKRIGVFGWGIVAPKSANIEAFASNLAAAESWLEPFNGFGPDTFLVGRPAFRFSDYKPWIDARFPPGRYPQLDGKMDMPTKYAIGAFIQALGQNPGLEQELTRLGAAAHVYIGSGLGSLGTIGGAAVSLHRAQRRWNRFWSQPERNAALAEYLAHPERFDPSIEVPTAPEEAPPDAVEDAEDAWWAFWVARSSELRAYLDELREIESFTFDGPVETGKIAAIKEKQRRRSRLQRRWGAPNPPWHEVSANLLWNIHNTPAAQITMLGRITGLAFGPAAACSTFGVTLKLAMDAIRRGEAKAVVMGATDPPPLAITVGGFYAARVISADGQVSKPLTTLRGTHVAGGAAIWIIGDLEHMTGLGFEPVGLEPVAVGVSSDADHIITPSAEGPRVAIRQALALAGVEPEEIVTWDLHATATPGDFQEVENLRGILPEQVLVSARKGTFGHGMGASGGFELTAQYLGCARGELFPSPTAAAELNQEIARLHRRFVFDASCPSPRGWAGKLSMGVGGINACVLSRPYPD